MRIIFTIILALFCHTTILFPQTDWEWQYSTTTENLNDVYFLDMNKGWAVGNNGTIINTLNGGDNWLQQKSGTNNNLKAVRFLNENLGWVVGNEAMLFTEDGGLTWSKYLQGHIKDINCIFFIDEYNGWACGSDSIILKTKSSGANWEAIPSMVGKFDDIFFINDTLGWFHSQDDAGYIYMTEDGGNTLINKSRSRKSFQSFFFLEPHLGWACGGLIDEINEVGGWVDISTNGADKWTEQFRDGLMNSVYFFNEYHGVALGQRNRGTIIKKIYDVFLSTIDGGQNWVYCEPGGNAFHFIDQNTGWIVGYRGKIYKTTNGGGILNLVQEKNIHIKEYGLSQNYPNPFNPTTIINYELQTTLTVELNIYNVLGEKVTTLISKTQKSGHHQVEWDASGYASGIYYYQIQAGEFQDVKKMILLR